MATVTIIMANYVYDPVKAHEYYLRTRQLKGRRKAQSVLSTHTPRAPRSTTYTVRTPSGKTVRVTKQQLDEQKAYAAKRVGEIKQKLQELGAKLRKMKSEAQKKEAASKREAKKKPTAAEKSKAAKESEKYRKEHKQELKNKAKKTTKKESAPKDPVAELEHRVAEIKGRLSAAVAKQRALVSATPAK